MQATLDSFSMKQFTKALTCLSRYGEELAIYATSESISFRTTNSSKTAHASFEYGAQFFSRYSVLSNEEKLEGVKYIAAQLLTKSLLSILKHNTVEKTVEKCEMTIVEGSHDSQDEDEDSLESKLILRLYCKYGVTKTHRLLLSTPTSFHAPASVDSPLVSTLLIGPKAVKEMIEHVHVSKGGNSSLIWTFDEGQVAVKTLESKLDSKGRGQLSTELTISSDEFDSYDVRTTPTSISFHLREFNASITFAEQMSSPLELRFTDPTDPLYVHCDGDNYDALFVISTSQPPASSSDGQTQKSSLGKRTRDTTVEPGGGSRRKKPNKVVQSTPVPPSSSSYAGGQSLSMPPPSLPRSPLFLPASSQQMSQAQHEMMVESGLGLESMSKEELDLVLGLDEDEDDEMELALPTSSFQMQEEDGMTTVEPTQHPPHSSSSSGDDSFSREFRPLFDD